MQYCPFGKFALDSNRTCQSTCPKYKFVNFTLSAVQYQCVAKCPSNTFLNSTDFCVNATSCPTSMYGDPTTGTCVGTCPNNSTTKMYADTNANVKLCVYFCPTNFYRQSIVNHVCVSACDTNYFIDYVNSQCVQRCPDGTYSYLDGTCVNACPNSFYADKYTNKCDTICSNSTFKDATSNYCVNICPPGYFGDITGGYNCASVCSSISEYGDPVQRLCVVKASCTAPYIFADDYTRRCVTLCPASQNTYGDSTNSNCTMNCPWTVGLYTFRDPSTQTCVTKCPVNPSLYADNSTKTCVDNCPANSYAVDATRTCEYSCPNNFYINNVTRRCVSICPTEPKFTYFYALNTSSSQCLEVCPLTFLADPTTMTCINTTCPNQPALYAFNRTCISICPNGTYSN